MTSSGPATWIKPWLHRKSSATPRIVRSYLISLIVHKTRRLPIFSAPRVFIPVPSPTQTQMPPTRTSCSRSNRRKSRMTTVPSEIRASKSFNASTENLLLFFAGFVADWVTRVQDGTLEADAGRNAWEIYRADPREGSHPDECVSPTPVYCSSACGSISRIWGYV